MTHSHDTSTPAMSAETVPSEEFVLVPREPTQEMKSAILDSLRYDSDIYVRDDETIVIETVVAQHVYRAMIAAAPAPNPSPAAKGGEAVQKALRKHARNLHQMAANYGSHSSTSVVASAAAFAVENFLDSLSTPTEGPASQTEGMGGDAVREAFRAGWKVNAVGTDVHPQEYLDGCEEVDWEDYAARAALTPPETAEAVPVGAGVKPFVYLREHDMRELAMHASRSRDTRIYCDPTFEGEKLHPLYSLPEVSRLQEELERRLRVGELLGEAFEENKIALVAALRERDEAVKALETARVDDRDRLFELFERQGAWTAAKILRGMGAMLPADRARLRASREAQPATDGGDNG